MQRKSVKCLKAVICSTKNGLQFMNNDRKPVNLVNWLNESLQAVDPLVLFETIKKSYMLLCH